MTKLDPFLAYAARLEQREAYQRGKAIDNGLIAEMKAKEARAMTRRPQAPTRSRSTTASPMASIERRDFMARMVALTGSVAAANALIGTIAARADAAPLVDPDDRRLTTRERRPSPAYKAYVAEPRTALAQAHRPRDPREPRPQRAYPRRRPPARAGRLSAPSRPTS